MISNLIEQSKIAQAQQYIDQAEHVVILTHTSPDGDAMGSSLAMMHFMRALGKDVTVVLPTSYPSFLAWMPGADSCLIYDGQQEAANPLVAQADLIICTDFNEPKRIGLLGDKIIENPCPKIMIDHHLHPSDFCTITLSFPETPSASELVYRFIYQMEHSTQPIPMQMSEEERIRMVTCIYTGMMTDTGNFSFNSNYPEMYEIVGDLVRQGVNKDAIYNNVFNAYKADRMRLMGYCLYQKMKLLPIGKDPITGEDMGQIALIYLSRKELYRFNFQSGDAEGLVNLPLQIKDVYYSCFMREDKVNTTEAHLANGSTIKVKISMRSQGNRPVNTFCHDIFNGGGHANASGGEYYGAIEDAVRRFMANYQNYFAPQAR